MKLFDKIKDLFMDEVDLDDEIEIDDGEEVKPPKKPEPAPVPKREESVLPKVMRETIEKEEKKEEVKLKVNPEEFIKEIGSRQEANAQEKKPEPVVTEKKINYPIEFSLDEIPARTNHNRIDSLGSNNVNKIESTDDVSKKLSEYYQKKEEPKEKSKFKASPVISPVYGVLDKNYTKEEVIERDEDAAAMKRPSKKVDFEMVRKKAFGNLADDIKDNLLCENCELYKEVKRLSALKEDDLLYDMTVDNDEEKDEEVTISKAYENYQEFGVAYEPKKEKRTTYTKEEISVVEEPVKEEEPKEGIPAEKVTLKTSETKDEESMPKLNFSDIANATYVDDDEEEEEEELKVLDKPEVLYQDKVEDEPEVEEEVPKRSIKKSEDKVDDDFFELIDSMYKERTDE